LCHETHLLYGNECRFLYIGQTQAILSGRVRSGQPIN
jgi:hypothetical protein